MSVFDVLGLEIRDSFEVRKSIAALHTGQNDYLGELRQHEQTISSSPLETEPMRNILKMMTVVTCFGLLTFASTVDAQSTQKGVGEMATKAMPAKTMEAPQMSRAFTNGYNVPSTGVAIEGYCPVCYLAANKAVKGTPDIAYDYNGVTYWFVKEGARQAFIANPKKFLPAYGGWCALGASMGQRFPVDPTNFKIVDGRIMLFLKNAKVNGVDTWNQNEAEMVRKADENWKKLGG